jgi:hypothetical protein
MNHPNDPDATFPCDTCPLLPEDCGHDAAECEADQAANEADFRRKSLLEDGDDR